MLGPLNETSAPRYLLLRCIFLMYKKTQILTFSAVKNELLMLYYMLWGCARPNVELVQSFQCLLKAVMLMVSKCPRWSIYSYELECQTFKRKERVTVPSLGESKLMLAPAEKVWLGPPPSTTITAKLFQTGSGASFQTWGPHSHIILTCKLS